MMVNKKNRWIFGIDAIEVKNSRVYSERVACSLNLKLILLITN